MQQELALQVLATALPQAQFIVSGNKELPGLPVQQEADLQVLALPRLPVQQELDTHVLGVPGLPVQQESALHVLGARLTQRLSEYAKH